MFSKRHWVPSAITLAFLLGSWCRAEEAGTAAGANQPQKHLLPSWLTLGGEVRGRLDSYTSLSGVSGKDDTFYLHRLRLNARVAPLPWMKFYLQGQDSRVADYDRHPIPFTVQNSADLRQAYVDLGHEPAEGWTVRLGRQPLVFGDMRLVSTSNWGNVGPNYDGVRLMRNYGRVHLDAFYTFVGVPDGNFHPAHTGRRLAGAQTSWETHKNGPTIEAYMFWKRNQSATGERGGFGRLNVYTYGVRSLGKLGRGFDYRAEMAMQRGNVVSDSVRAWAGHWEVGRPLAKAAPAPRVAVEYNYASGDANPRDGSRHSFDQLYPTNVYGTAGDFGWRNLHEPAVTLELTPARAWKIKNTFHGFWLADTHDALYTFSGAVFAPGAKSNSSRVGTEFDTRVIWQAARRLQIYAGYAHLFPGPYLRAAGQGAAIHYPYVMWTATF